MASPVNTSLTCTSAKVWAFYHEHPEIDFEKMNIMFTDIIASIMQSTNPVNNSNITSQILNSLENIQSQLTNQQTEYGKLLFLKLTEFKKEYIDDLKMILSSNIADKIAPLIKESNGSILDKTQLLLTELVPKNNENLSKQINENIKSFCSSITDEINKTSNNDSEPLSQSSLDDFIKTIDSKFSNVIDTTRKMVDSNKDATLSQFSSISSSQIALQSEVKDVLKRMENSSSKGKMSENIVLNILRGLFPSAEVEYVGSQKESGDIMIHRKDRQRILVENKCYESRQVTTTDDYSISKDTLEEINREYQLFVEQKLNQLKMVKEFSQKMIKNIEDLQLPCFEKMLSSRFGYITSGKFICEKCNFIGKNPLALSVHKRTCDKTNSLLQETSSVSPMTILLQTPSHSVAQPIAQPIAQQQQLVQPKIIKTLTKNVIQVKPDYK